MPSLALYLHFERPGAQASMRGRSPARRHVKCLRANSVSPPWERHLNIPEAYPYDHDGDGLARTKQCQPFVTRGE